MPSSSSTLQHARTLHENGQLGKAEQVYRELLALEPDDPLLLQGLGMLALQSGHMQHSRELLTRAALLGPDIADVWMAMGQHEETHGRWHEAVAHFDRALSLKTDSVIAHSKRAFALEMSGQVEAASLAYRAAQRVALRDQSVATRSPWRNIYHCCTQKTASQWIRTLFTQPVIYRATEMLTQPYVQLGLNEADIKAAWPARTIVCHLYVNFATFDAMEKPGRHRSFFVLRDPRDAVVSWYHSARYSHNSAHPILYLRQQLEKRTPLEGLQFMTDWLEQVGYFDAQRSWIDAKTEGRGIEVFHYEHLNQDVRGFTGELLDYLQIPLSTKQCDDLAKSLAFERFSGGRDKSDLDIHSHYRKAEIGDWKRYLTGAAKAHFEAVTDDLVTYLGYE